MTRPLVGRLREIAEGRATDLAPDVLRRYRGRWLGRTAAVLDFDRVVLVNLARRRDRLDQALAQLRPPLWPFREPVVFQAVDGRLVPTPPGWKQGGGSWGCMQSHRQIVERALMDGVNHLLVLEDDLLLRRSFRESVGTFCVAVPADADGLFLGGQHHVEPEPVCPGVVRCLNTQRTHAYSARRPWMEELYRIWCSPHAAVHCDWLMGPACRRFHLYAPYPFLVGQRRSQSDITCRTQPAKFWQPPGGCEPIIVLRSPRDVADKLRSHGWHRGFDLDSATGIDTGLERVARRQLATKTWITDLQWEVVSEEDWVLVVWHPEIRTEAIQVSWSGPVVEITAETVESALEQWRAWQSRHGKGSVAG